MFQIETVFSEKVIKWRFKLEWQQLQQQQEPAISPAMLKRSSINVVNFFCFILDLICFLFCCWNSRGMKRSENRIEFDCVPSIRDDSKSVRPRGSHSVTLKSNNLYAQRYRK